MDFVRKLASYAVFQVVGFRPSPVSGEAWDREYRSGHWDYLGELDNLGGLASILGYCQFLSPDSILDVGCGTGLLARKLKVLPFKCYLGVDLSVEAIAQAAPVADERTVFAVAEAGGFECDRRFDVIVFSQILNYVPRPNRMLARYAGLLEPDGRIIVSMYGSGRTRAAWRLIEKTMMVEDAMSVTQTTGTTTTKVLKPRG
ncbi:MAG TPA: class I SAM-dependent methyltransferase [Rhizomicrobium sp.]|nr:class I SAM-dependent methyltransferase [Rhizomicrobium sp.]